MQLATLPFEAMGTQPAFLPDQLEHFVNAPRIATLAYTKRDGAPTQAPIWYRYQDGRFAMLTATTSPKAKGLARAGRACLTIQDDTPPYRAVIVDGTVTLSPVPLDAALNGWLAVHYFGRIGGAEYLTMTAADNAATGLSLVTLDPTRVRGFDNHRLIGSALRLYMRLRDVLPIPRTWL